MTLCFDIIIVSNLAQSMQVKKESKKFVDSRTLLIDIKTTPKERMETFYLRVQKYTIFFSLKIFIVFSSRFNTQCRLMNLGKILNK